MYLSTWKHGFDCIAEVQRYFVLGATITIVERWALVKGSNAARTYNVGAFVVRIATICFQLAVCFYRVSFSG